EDRAEVCRPRRGCVVVLTAGVPEQAELVAAGFLLHGDLGPAGEVALYLEGVRRLAVSFERSEFDLLAVEVWQRFDGQVRISIHPVPRRRRITTQAKSRFHAVV